MGQKEQPQHLILNTEEKFDAWKGSIPAWNSWATAHLAEGFTPLDSDREVGLVLVNDAAIALHERGQVNWNSWVKENPDAKVEFNSFEFGEREKWSFEYLTFPDGGVLFAGCYFNAHEISFKKAKFGVYPLAIRKMICYTMGYDEAHHHRPVLSPVSG